MRLYVVLEKKKTKYSSLCKIKVCLFCNPILSLLLIYENKFLLKLDAKLTFFEGLLN